MSRTSGKVATWLEVATAAHARDKHVSVRVHPLTQAAGEVPSKRRDKAYLSVITGFDVVMVTLRDGELPHERRSALLLEREGALHSGVFKAMPFGCGLRPQP